MCMKDKIAKYRKTNQIKWQFWFYFNIARFVILAAVAADKWMKLIQNM